MLTSIHMDMQKNSLFPKPLPFPLPFPALCLAFSSLIFAVIYARYAWGEELERCVDGMTEAQVTATVKELYEEGLKLPGCGPFPMKDII